MARSLCEAVEAEAAEIVVAAAEAEDVGDVAAQLPRTMELWLWASIPGIKHFVLM